MRTECFVAYACTLYVMITTFAYLRYLNALQSTTLWQNWTQCHNDSTID